MGNCVFGWPIYSDVGVTYTPTLSGGSWNSSLPLTNAQDRRLAKVARSSDALAASTQFDADLGVSRSIRVIAVLLPNITTAAEIRVRASAVSDFSTTVYDSGTAAAWPSGIDAEESEGMNVWTTLVLPAAQSGRYVRIEVTDTTNTDGHVDVARVVVAGGWQPTINMAEGAKLGLVSETERSVTDGGAAIYNDRPRRRTMTFDIEDLPSDEALERGFDMQRIAGTSRQMYFVFDPDDTSHMHRRAFLATLRELTAVEYPYYNRGSIPFQLTEEL